MPSQSDECELCWLLCVVISLAANASEYLQTSDEHRITSAASVCTVLWIKQHIKNKRNPVQSSAREAELCSSWPAFCLLCICSVWENICRIQTAGLWHIYNMKQTWLPCYCSSHYLVYWVLNFCSSQNSQSSKWKILQELLPKSKAVFRWYTW